MDMLTMEDCTMEDMYECHKCDKAFTQLSAMKTGNLAADETKAAYQCAYCDYGRAAFALTSVTTLA